MPTTAQFKIPYPDGTSTLTPLEARFADIANGVETALTTGLGGAPQLANSDTERNSLIPSPSQGNTVLRPDKGWTEQYFGLYDATNNPAGAATAGWYPVSGKLPFVRYSRQGSATIGAASGSAFAWDTLDLGALNGITYNAGTFTVQQPGRYRITASVTLTSGQAISAMVGIRKNQTAAFGHAWFTATGAYSTGEVSGTLILAAGDTFDAVSFAGGTIGIISTNGGYHTTFMEIEYLGAI